MEKMTEEEVKYFLLGSPRTAKVATVREDGRPHVAPVWFDMDEDKIIFTTWHDTVKYRNLIRDPRISLCVDDEQVPFAYVLIDGIVHIESDPELLAYWAKKIASRYMGSYLGDQYGKRNSVEGEMLIIVTPTKINAQKGISD